jgi:hypothetical protein
VPKSLQHWYDGKTQVTLPDGRQITPAANTYLLYNPDLFTGNAVQLADGSYGTLPYWWGNTAPAYGDLRSPAFKNVNLTVERKFQFTEKVNFDLLAEATNAFNNVQWKPNAINTSGGINTDPTMGPVGANTNVNFGALQLNSGSLYEPRQITITLRIQF